MINNWSFLIFIYIFIIVYLIVTFFQKNWNDIKSYIKELKIYDIILIVFILAINFTLIYIIKV